MRRNKMTFMHYVLLNHIKLLNLCKPNDNTRTLHMDHPNVPNKITNKSNCYSQTVCGARKSKYLNLVVRS